MRNCKDFEEMLEKYIDNELKKEEVEILKIHMDQCSACREMLEFSKAIRTELKKIELPDPPSDFVERVNLRINENADISFKKQNFARFFNRRTIQSVAACFLLAVFLGWGGEFIENFNNKEENFEKVPYQTIINGDKTKISSDNNTRIMPLKETQTPAPLKNPKENNNEKKEEKSKQKATSKPVETIGFVEDNIEKQPAQTEEIKQEKEDILINPEENDENESEVSYNLQIARMIEGQEVGGNAFDEENIAPYNAEEKKEEPDEEGLVSEPEPTEDKEGNNNTEELYKITAYSPETSGGGSSGGGSSVILTEKEPKPADGKLLISANKLNDAKNVALSYGSLENEVYGMSSEKFAEFLTKLDELGIEYNLDFEKDAAVRFMIVEQ